MEIIRAKTAGFCFGVDRAVKLTYDLLAQGRKVATLGPLIHNAQVVADLEAKGAVTCPDIDAVPDGYEVIIRSHGVTPDVYRTCEARGIPTLLADAVCMSMALDPAKRFASAEALGRATRAAYDLSRPVRPPAPAPVRTPDSETALTPQGLQNPAGLPRPAASAACGLLSRVPESLGRIWNTLVCFSLLVFFVGSHFAVFHPTGANQSYPTWLLIIEYFFFVDGLMVLMHFALFDKRRLRRRFALLDSYRGKKLAKLWLKALGVLLLCMIVIVAVANATGVVDTSAT